MNRSNDVLALLGRIALAAIFVWSGSGKITGFSSTAGYIASKGLPMPVVLTALTIFVELILGLAIIIGWRARIAALLIALWLIPTTFLFHNFWSAPAAQVTMQQINFMKNVSIFGGMLLLMAFGAGRYSVDGGRR
ncbi:MAG TPA: DoxX family protein [Casimicrobiaceae bacterium]|nr:DoxX family protein [Casimicrobiaceae bacterium]